MMGWLVTIEEILSVSAEAIFFSERAELNIHSSTKVHLVSPLWNLYIASSDVTGMSCQDHYSWGSRHS